MDKEAQEKIAGILDAYDLMTAPSDLTEFLDKDAMKQSRIDQICQALDKLGYRKLPKDKPPLLSDEEIARTLEKLKMFKGKNLSDAITEADRVIAQAQWDIWNKAIYGEYEH